MSFWQGFNKRAAAKQKQPNFIADEARAIGFGKQPPQKKPKKLKSPPPEPMASDIAILGSQAMHATEDGQEIAQKKTVPVEGQI